jgi:hypothetical protein
LLLLSFFFPYEKEKRTACNNYFYTIKKGKKSKKKKRAEALSFLERFLLELSMSSRDFGSPRFQIRESRFQLPVS